MTTVRDLARLAIARSLFAPTTLKAAIEQFGFVQADPIRAPARAQDLTLRHRVVDYHAGDLERDYAALGLEEDVFINYGYVSRDLHTLMHPRTTAARRPSPRSVRERNLLAFLRERGEAHPADVDQHFSHGRVTNYWGGSSRATTYLLEHMHYRGLVRVIRRDRGVRIYAPREHGDSAPPERKAGWRRAGDEARESRLDRLVDVAVNLYAPLPQISLGMVVARLRYAVPHWRSALKQALHRARARLAHASVDGIEWYWPANEMPPRDAADDGVRLLTPFDPIVWDRRRFELLWGWPYRFEAYTPVRQRKFGYYALPLLWRGQVIGWANLTTVNETLQTELGFARSRPRDRAFTRAVTDEIDRMRTFLMPRPSTRGAIYPDG